MVIPTAGMITLQEVNYTRILMKHLAKRYGFSTVAHHD
jgi:hypothetical protein